MRKESTIVSLAIALLLLAPVLLFAQSEKGALVGTITDSNGAAVPNVTVTITDLGNKTTLTFSTNSDGIYSAPFLNPGTYDVLAVAPGFAKAIARNIVVSVGSRVRADLELKVGSVNETITVEESAALLQTENASIGQVVSAKQLTELPSINRNIYSFLTLDSTVNNGPTGNAEAFRLESGGSFAVAGSRPSSVTFKIDGQANNDPTFGTPTITPSLDTVKEFKLQNNAYSAEFEGITQVNVATKSGNNRLHGSLFEFAQNSFFEPRNPLAAKDKSGKPGKNKLRYNQFGFTIGGPVWLPRFGEGGPTLYKPSTFFFFSYEGLRNNQRALAFGRVLTQAERTGDFSASLGSCITAGGTPVPLLNPNGTPSGNCIRAGQIFDPATTVANPLFNAGQAQSALNPQFIRQPFANNQIPAGRINSNATALINIQQSLPNFVSTSDLNFAGPAGSNFLNNQYSIRIDHKISDDDSVYGRFTRQNNVRDTESVLPFQAKSLRGKGIVFNSSWTHIFSPVLVNELRLGYVRGIYGESISEIDPTQFGVKNTTGNTIPGIFLTSGGQLTYGGFTASLLETKQNTYQLADNLSLTFGLHNIKVGFKADHNRFKNIDRIQSPGLLNFNGLFSVGNSSLGGNASRPNSIADFLLGNISSETLNLPNAALVRQTPWAVYFQDDWRINSRLTLNLGLRYELHQPFRDEHLGGRRVDLTGEGRLLVADPEVARLANSPLVVCCTSSRVVDTDKNDFGPRIGIAYRPFEKDNTVVRAGYGLFYADTSQFFHWLYYVPLQSGSFTPALASFQTPSATLNDPFPIGNFSPPGGSGIFIGTPAGVNPAALNNQPVISISGLGPYKTPQSQQWSFGVQREILKDMVLDLSYKGASSRNLPLQWFFNQPTFSATAPNFQSLDPAANPYLRRKFDNFTIGSNIVANVLKSNYNAMTLKVEKRFSKGYSFLSGYTWSKALDQGAEVFSVVSNHAFLPDNNNFNANRGVSVYDVPHRWVTSGSYDLPFGKGKMFLNQGGVVDALIGGWRLSGIFTLQSGMPFQPSILGNRFTNTGISVIERGDYGNVTPYTSEEWQAALAAWNKGARLFFVKPGTININYAPGTGGNIGRNAFRTPYGRRLDLSLAKVTRLGENARFELRVDMFDVTREVLHRPSIANSVAALTALTNPLTVGSIPGRNLFFIPYILQVGGRFTF
jgi:hypothetical protein